MYVIYDVFTLVGGFLASLDFRTRDSVVPFGNYLSKSLHLSVDETSRRNCLFAFLQCLEGALYNQVMVEAVEVLEALEYVLRNVAGCNDVWKEAAKRCWQRAWVGGEAPDMICPRGKSQEGGYFAEHMATSHLVFFDKG